MKLLVKIVVALLVLSGLAWLFIRTASDVRSEPYVVERAHLAGWRLALEDVGDTRALLVLRPPQEFSGSLFRQIFSRMMESMKGTSTAGVPIILRDEYEFALAGRYTPQALLDAARAAGLESAPFLPQCVALRRISEPGLTRQAYFVVFDAPAFGAFRDEIAREAAPGAAGSFDAPALSPVLIVGATDDADRWLPIRTAADDCVAPIAIE